MQYSFYILLGLLPSLIWLSFYLKKDTHPEPNSMVLKIFIWGIIIAPLAIFFELVLIWLLDPSSSPLSVASRSPQESIIKIILASTLIPALVEEYLKYSVVKFKVLKNPEFDEPIDAMLYCLIAGLGFAAIENLLILFQNPLLPIGEAFATMAWRFAGATLVHALASAMVGYWLAKSILYIQKRKIFITTGLALAIVFHACYNYLIILISTSESPNVRIFFFTAVIALMITAALLVSAFFKRIKKQQAICKINEQ